MATIEELRKICQDRPDKHDFYMWGIIRKISIYLTWLIVRTHITPNQVTSLSIAFGIVGSLFFLSPNPWYWIAGWLVINLHLILDQCDGEVAYYKKNVTKFGYFFDELSHPIVNIFFFNTIMMSIYFMTNAPIFLFFGSALVFSNSIYRIVGLYEDHINKEMFKLKTRRLDTPESWFIRIVNMPRGLGGYFHIFFVAAIFDIISIALYSQSMGDFRVGALVIMGTSFPILLIRRIYSFKKRIKDSKIRFQ